MPAGAQAESAARPSDMPSEGMPYPRKSFKVGREQHFCFVSTQIRPTQDVLKESRMTLESYGSINKQTNK